jgi:hypothetical protein
VNFMLAFAKKEFVMLKLQVTKFIRHISRSRFEDNIKIYLIGIGYEDVGFI